MQIQRARTPRRVEFHPRKQLDFMSRHGQRVLYEESYRCACFDADSGNKDIKHNECDVDGYRYKCSIPTTAIITSVQDKEGFNQSGQLKQGDCIGGFPWQIPIKFHDKVQLRNHIATNEVLLVQDDEFAPTIKDYNVCQLGEARTIDRVFQPYKDFNLGGIDGHSVIWTDPNNKPYHEEHFTLQFGARPTYIVWRDGAMARISENKYQLTHVILRMKDEWGNLGRDYLGGSNG